MTVRALFSMGVNVLGGIYIYIFKISMSHDLKVSSLASLARCN